MAVYPIKEAHTDREKVAVIREIFGDKADAVLNKCGTLAYDFIYLNTKEPHKYYGFSYANPTLLYSQVIKAVETWRPQDLALYTHDKYTRDHNWNVRTAEVNTAIAKYNTVKRQEEAEAARAAAEANKPAHSLSDAEMKKLSDFLTRTVGSSDMAEALAVKFGDKAYAVALSAVMEPGAMTSELRFNADGKFSSKNVMKALISDNVVIDEAKMSSFLDGYAERKAARDAAANTPHEEPAPRAEEPRRVLKIADIEPPQLDLGVVAKPLPENITIKSLPFMQDGKRYDLYHLPENFVIKGDLDLSNRGLTELPDLSGVKVKGNLLLNGNELTSIDGVLPEVGGNIDLRNNKLTSLKGMPEVVKGNFSCEGNLLTSLEGGPREVKGAFDCRGNQLTTLEGGPEKVGRAYICSDNALTSLKGAPSKINGTFACDNNKLNSIEGAPQSIAGDFMADNTMSEALKRDLKNTVKIAGIQHLITSDQPTQEDTRFDQAYARRSADEREDALKPFNIIDMMNDMHSYRGK